MRRYEYAAPRLYIIYWDLQDFQLQQKTKNIVLYNVYENLNIQTESIELKLLLF